MEKILQILFSLVYGKGTKDQKIANQIYQMIRSYLAEWKDNPYSIYDKQKDPNNLLTLLPKSKKDNSIQKGTFVIFASQYGCALLISKQKNESAIKVQIIVPEEWATGSTSSKSSQLQYCSPKNQSSIYTPELTQYEKPLNQFLQSFENNLFSVLESIKQKSKNQASFTPAQIQKTVKMILTKMKNSKKTEKKKKEIVQDEKSEQQSQEDQQQQKDVQPMSKNISFKNQETNTAWYVIEALLRKIFKDRYGPKQGTAKYEKLLIGFKASILSKVINQKLVKKVVKRNDTINFKKCLDNLIYSYKYSVSLYTRNHQKFLKIIRNLEKQIIEANGGRLNSQISNQQYKDQPIDLKHIGVPKIIKPQKIKYGPKNITMAKIQQYNYEIDYRLPFQFLLNMFEEIKNISEQKKQKKQQFLDHWVSLTQKTLFEYAHQIYLQDEKKPYIDLQIHMRQIQCEFGAANICKLAQTYEQIIKSNQKYYGMGMIGQAKSHVQLVKTICAVVAFQSVKMNREKKKSNLNNYKVPIDIETLNKNFISHDFLARRAMRCLQKYQSKRSKKNPLFDLNGSCSSFSQFGKAVGQDTRSSHVWLAYMRKLIDLEKEKIMLGIKKQQLTIRLKQAEENPQLCRNINWKISSYSIATNEYLQEFSQQQKWLYAFLNNIPPDILGLIKISMIAQNPEQGGTVSLKNNQFEILNSIQFLNNEELPLKVHNLKTPTIPKPINSASSDLISSIPIKYPNNNIRFVYGVNNSVFKGGFRAGMFEHYDIENVEFQEKIEQKKSAQLELKKFLKPPSDKILTREHDVYAKLHLKPKNIEIQQFLALCTTRAGEQTQIVALCSNILQRKIIANCYDIGHKFKEELFLQTAGQIFAYKTQTQKHFGMIRKILQQFINKWVFSDTNFCPILGPFLAYLAAQLKDYGAKQQQINELRKISLKLVQKCWEEFERGERQLKDDPSLKIQWDQRFIITAAICCFRQIILTQEDKQQLVFLAKLIFQFRISKIFSGREQKSKDKRKFEEQRAYSITRAIFKNIKVLSSYLIKNPTQLNKVLRQSDQGFPQHIDWQKNQIYQFIGKSKESSDVYQIDLYRGFIYKNGKQLSALDPEIKNNENYKIIFGEHREFQVYPSNDHHFVRTKNNLNHQFKIDPQIQQIYFQFSEDGKIIRYISRRPHQDKEKVKQFKWQLLENRVLNEFLHIPAIFLEDYLAWICIQKNCIVYRKKNFEEMYEIGLVIHLKNYTEKQFQIQKAFHVVFHGGFQNQNSDEILDINNQKYEEIILRSKQKPLNSFNPYKYLEKIEKSKFVFELKNQKTQEIYFLLYRYKLRFMVKGNKLISESHYGYQIDCSYYNIKQCLFNFFPCLVLLKDPKNQMILNNHHRILIVSDGKIQQDGHNKKDEKGEKDEKGSKILKSKKANAQINSYRYDIHDFFGDIRGPTRQSQLHLVCLMLSIDNNLRLSSMEMTPLQYALHSLKTCFTNRPFNKNQKKKLEKIFQLANNYNFDEGLLLCEALWKGSKKLKNILPFSQNSQKSFHDFLKNQTSSQALLRCRTLYNKKISNCRLNYRLKINPNLLQSIGFIVKYQNNAPNEAQGSSDDQFQKEGFWKGIKQYDGSGISQQCDKINEIYKNICVNTKIFDFWKKQYPNKKEENQYEKFPEVIQQNTNNDNKSLMMKQLVQQLRSSYECFIKQQLRLEHVIEEFKDNNKKKNIVFIKTFISDCLNCLHMIQQLIDKVKKQNEGHPDIISGYRPTLSQLNYTRVLCYEEEIYAYYPQMKKQAADKLKSIIKIWMDLQTRIASYKRVEVLLQSQKVDIVALLREIGSPREQIFKKTEWVCFETEMKIQIWPSQLETYDNLMKDTKNGPFCQLNMGQGKTQVIIPMIVLHTIFNRKDTIPRINLLTSLYEQARGNMFRFLSVTGFQIPGFQIPFKRHVQLDKHNIYKIRDLMNSFEGKAYILVNRQSRLSQILRFNELALVKPQLGISLSKMPLLNCKLFDIFDEIDALMTSKKSYIFSIGNQIQLPSSSIRLQIMKQFIQIFLTNTLKQLLDEKMATTDQTVADALQVIRKGQYPDGLRLTLQNTNKDKIKQWRNKIADLILRDPNRHEYSFIKRLTQQQIANTVRYCTDPLIKSDILSPKIYKGSRDQIYILRGILAYGIFQHCLSKRCGVDYGVPGKQHKKRIAVPYEAADIPSKTSQYQHPEVSVLLSYVAYSMTGLTEDQFNDCLKALLLLTKTSMETQYQKWVNILAEQDRDTLQIKNANQINFISKAHRDYLFKIYGKNRMTVAFWLNKCIFPRDLKQYKQNICSSSFDLADVKQSIGFSGTMDNHWILPNKIKFSPCQTPSIRGTDGKMIYLATKCTKDICVIVQNEKPLWQRFVDLSLEKKVSCIIDVGAICVGKSLKNEIVPWIAEHQNFDSQKFAGISFCDENGKWQIYDIETKYYINRGTTIPDHLTFVIFDQARTRGADLKMDENIVAAMSLGPDLTKDKFMQAAGRLRKLGRNQSIIILATHQVFSTLPTFPKQINEIDKKMSEISKKQLIELILAWCCHNTIKQNQNLLLQYSNLGWKYISSKVNKKPQPQEISSELEYKYEGALQTRMVSEINQAITSKKEMKQIEDQTAQHFCQILQKYGKNVPKQAGALDDVCQRQVQAEKELQKVQQNGFNNLETIAQVDPSKNVLQIKDTPYKFDKQFCMSSNFINTTKQPKKQDQKLPVPIIGTENELPSCYFVKYNEKQFMLISLREASLFIKQKVLKESKDNTYKIALYNQLSLEDEYIKQKKLGGAMVCAKFIAGIQNYSKQQQQYLIQLFKRSLQNNKQEDKLKSYEDTVSMILRLRRVHRKKYTGSTLQKMIVSLANQDAR